MLRLEGDIGVANTLHALEILRSIDKATLGVGAAVYEVGVIQGSLYGSIHNVVSSLNTLHE